MSYQTVSASCLSVSGKPIALVPWPQSVAVEPGKYVSLLEGTVVESEAVEDLPGGLLARELADELNAATGGVWQTARGGWPGEVRLDIDDSLGEQASRIDITDGGIAVTGGDRAGLRSAVATVRQLLRQCGGRLPVLRIVDAPVFKVRGYYLDVTRGRVPTLQWLKQWADNLELYKYNQLQLYIEHSFAFPGLSEAWRGLDPLTPNEIMEFDRYCAERGIELVPSVSTFGHLYVILRTHEFRELGEFPEDADRPFSFIERQEHHTLNVALDKAFAFSVSLIDRYMPLFSSKKFNIGADETFDLGRGRSRLSMGDSTISSVYADYVNRLSAHIAALGHEPMMWADIVLQYPDMLPKLDRKTTLLNWQYSPQVTEKTFDVLAEAGARQYVCPAVHGWNQLLPSLDDAWENTRKVGRYGQQSGAAGYLVTDWGDYGHVNDPRLSMPGMMYGAETAWRGESDDFEELNLRVERLSFGDTGSTVLKAWRDCRSSSSFTWADAVFFLELDSGDGSLNKDVQHTFADVADSRRQAVADAGDLVEARRRLLTIKEAGLRQVPQKASALEQMQEALQLAGVRVNDNAMAGVLLRMAQGLDLFDRCGWWLARDCGLIAADADDEEALPSPVALVGQIECWFEGYRAMWRQVSKESELGRIGQVVWRLADILRAMA
ncbi:family 20 glycosylhydrolase [Bifidobacterium sp. ESL0704]|uniref:beta-N-acetylhexosaminidase n=1 Tax=Bifidobacterium sp. ESL0704 TaxID=2983219 RepID=UPI0023F6A662|nr:family 20 glycosylhydrolase [Bifidobacterium sp. ESL0704]WEV53466.1 family 20 glycosylhydrolase [Bifidobacterium sp. ESL0704]